METVKPKTKDRILKTILIKTFLTISLFTLFVCGCDKDITTPIVNNPEETYGPIIVNEVIYNAVIEEYESLHYSMRFYIDMTEPEVGLEQVRFCVNYDTLALTFDSPVEFNQSSLVEEFGTHNMIYWEGIIPELGAYRYGEWTQQFLGYVGSGAYCGWQVGTPNVGLSGYEGHVLGWVEDVEIYNEGGSLHSTHYPWNTTGELFRFNFVASEQTDDFSWRLYENSNHTGGYVKPTKDLPIDYVFTSNIEVVKITLQINGATTEEYWVRP